MPIRRLSALLLALGVVSAAFFAGFWYRGNSETHSAPAQGARKILYWHDPMHPAYKSDKPGIAPDCGMQLEPVYEDGNASEPAPSASIPGSLKISPDRQQLIGVRTGRAEALSSTQTMRLLGRVAVDETRIYRLFAAVDGWMREISPYAVGNIVDKNELLATYFSRDLLTPQQAYIYALNSRDQALQNKDANPDQVRVSEAQVRNSEEGLRTLGMTEHQIQEVARARSSVSIMQVRAPATGMVLQRNVAQGLRIDRATELYRMADLSRVWVLADLYELETRLIPLGAQAQVRYQDQVFPATISKALPVFDSATRTMKLRLELDNPGYALRPDMFVDVQLPVQLPAAITVPADAVVDSGRRKIVYVDLGDGMFEPRQVKTGWRFGERVAITEGLRAGERVVVSGTFLLDSESRMKSAAAGITGTPAKDPVCSMEINEGTAKAAGRMIQHAGTTYYFCSDQCKQDFEKDPKKYLK